MYVYIRLATASLQKHPAAVVAHVSYLPSRHRPFTRFLQPVATTQRPSRPVCRLFSTMKALFPFLTLLVLALASHISLAGNSVAAPNASSSPAPGTQSGAYCECGYTYCASVLMAMSTLCSQQRAAIYLIFHLRPVIAHSRLTSARIRKAMDHEATR